MNAVAEKRQAKAQKHALTASLSPAPTFTEDAALFREAGNFLSSAAAAGESLEPCASDKLLGIATRLAFEAANGHLGNDTAIDIATCINAARWVPGAVESPERTQLIENAAMRLAEIAETSVERLISAHYSNPTSASAKACPKQFTAGQLKELYWQAFVQMTSARDVLLSYAEQADSSAVFAVRDLLDVYCEAADARFEDEKIGGLADGDLPDLSVDLDKVIALLGPLATVKDDGVLHAVALLLESAKRIVDGDLGVLQ